MRESTGPNEKEEKKSHTLVPNRCRYRPGTLPFTSTTLMEHVVMEHMWPNPGPKMPVFGKPPPRG
jgi:hypothetical protein